MLSCTILNLNPAVQDTELKFDLVSPVDELAKQIRLEFDFVHEASVMDSIADTLQVSLP